MPAIPDPWSDLLPEAACGQPTHDPFEEMLRLIAYDIADPKRLRRVAEACEDYGLRVQKSLFECWLDEERFDLLWSRLLQIIEPGEDGLAAYVIDRGNAARRRAAGQGTTLTRPRAQYVL